MAEPQEVDFMSRIISKPVLIAGAGPAGLSLAIELTRWGVPFEIVDSAEEPNPWSRAFTVHARTQEWLMQIGLIDEFLNRGLLHKSMDYRFEATDKVARLDFTQLTGTRYPHILISSQNMTETLLREYLSARDVSVRWGTKLTSATEDRDGVTVSLSRPDGSTETVRCQWLAGCDGVHSTVRGLIGVKYAGGDYAGRNRMMDTPMMNFWLGDDRIHYLITDAGMLLITKLPGENYRLLLSEPGGGAVAKKAVAREEFQRVLDRQLDGAATIGQPSSTSIFTIWKRQTPLYRRGRIFLVGDAGNLRSIAGGLGMNACIADGVNLGWKLAAVATGKAHAGLLDSYEDERWPADEQVGAMADLLHQILMDHERPMAERIAIVEEPDFHDRAVSMISGLGHTYRDVVSIPADVHPLTGLAAGDRAPELPLTGSTSVHDLLRHPGYTLLTLHHQPHSAWKSTDLASRVRQRFDDLVRVRQVSSPGSRTTAPTSTVLTNNIRVHDIYGATDSDVVCLIRPDGYLAGRVAFSEHEALLDGLDAVLS
ncbi:FAD-dependent monooxygenase [Nocardia wallacei]|nr:FAD-dependent monooxygenase [Nocardia wallacei]